MEVESVSALGRGIRCQFCYHTNMIGHHQRLSNNFSIVKTLKNSDLMVPNFIKGNKY